MSKVVFIDLVKTSLKFKKLRMDEILKPQSAIGAVVGKYNKDNTVTVQGTIKVRKVSKVIKHKIETMAAKKKAAGLGPGSAAQLKRAKQQAKQTIIQKSKGGYDLWDGCLI